jgi:eukaryotic-like serine/threonine-protein kinase
MNSREPTPVEIERWQQVARICESVVECDASDRTTALARLCGDDTGLRDEVESLLAEEVESFVIDRPAWESGAPLLAADVTPGPGVTIAHYRIVDLLGSGGMGDVYRARDTKLHRDVALKVLPEAFACDTERRSRFDREAQILASINHPNIGAIYGLEEGVIGDDADRQSAGPTVQALVLELVDGRTLADLLTHGPLPLADALTIARQIADALEAAHEYGIVHRDLKPANIKVRPDGTVKVLDFGLARTLSSDASGAVAMLPPHSSTVTSPAMITAGAVILGTAAYMSPEQAAGKAVDKRSDLWAFGVVLLEMLTGRPVFTGETVAHVLAEVLKSDPDLARVPAETPAPIRRLLRRCLEKDRKRRLDSAAAARLDIDDALALPSAEPIAAYSRRFAPSTVAGALASAAAIAGLVTWIAVRPGRREPLLTSRFDIVLPSGQDVDRGNVFDRSLALSPDGRSLAYRGGRPSTGVALIVRALDRLETQSIPAITDVRSPTFSSDSRWIGFFEDSHLKKVSTNGGPAITLCAAGAGPRGASWGDDNTIVFATSEPRTGLWRVSADGGEPVVLTTPDAAQHEADHVFPSVLPANRGVLFTLTKTDQPEHPSVAVLDAKTGKVKTLIPGGSQAEYVRTGHLVYAAAGALLAVRFDLARLEVLSDPVRVVDQVMAGPDGAANYAVSQAGTLVYVPRSATGPPTRSLSWVDRQGHEEPIRAPRRAYTIARLSPDGSRVALDIRDQENDIWIWNLARETLTPVTFGPSRDEYPVWTPDSQRIIFSSNRAGPPNLYSQAADGSGSVDRLTTSANLQRSTSITPDGASVVGVENTPGTLFDVFLFSRTSRSSTARGAPLIQTAALEQAPVISPGGRYVAYESNASGRSEIYVRPFPQVNSGLWKVSTAGGTQPAWAPNGRELFYVDPSKTLMAVPVESSGAAFSNGNPIKVFNSKSAINAYDVAPDGKRFLIINENVTDDATRARAGMIAVLNWFEELKRLLPTK